MQKFDLFYDDETAMFYVQLYVNNEEVVLVNLPDYQAEILKRKLVKINFI